MGYYCTPTRGTMEIMRPEGHFMPPEGCIMPPEGCRRPETIIKIKQWKKDQVWPFFFIVVQLIHRLTQADISCTTTARLFFFPLLEEDRK